MKTMLSEGYIPGAYTRKELRGYLQFFQFMNSGITVDKTRGRSLMSDKDAQWWLKRGMISQESYDRYRKELLGFMDFEALSDLTDEEIVYKIENLRMDCLTESEKKAVHFARENLRINFMKAFSFVGFPRSDDKYFDRKIPMGEARYIGRKVRNGYDAKELDKSVIKGKKEDYLLNLGKLQEAIEEVVKTRRLKIFASDFLFLKMILNELEGRFGEINKLDCTIILKDNPLYRDPELRDFDIDEYWDIQLNFKTYSMETAGFNLRNEALKKEFEEEESVIFVVGETAGMTFEGFNNPYWLFAVLETDKFCKYLGVLPSFEKKEKRVYIERIVPKWDYSFGKRFDGMERSTFNINSGVSHNRDKYMNMYSMYYDPENFRDLRISSDEWEKIILEREKQLIEKLKSFGVVYKNFRLKHDDGENIRFDIVKIAKNTAVKPFLAQDYDKSLINVREFKPLISNENKAFVFINFLYFATRKLVNLYNDKRSAQEHLKFSDFYIDSIYNPEKGITTLPLYNKGFIGYKDGEFVFGNERLGAGKLKIYDFEFEWSESAINTQNHHYKPVIFTPEFFQENSAERFDELIKDRINAIIVNDRLLTVRKGIVKMPPFGVVLSIPAAFEGESVEKMGLKESTDGYYLVKSDSEVHIDLKQNKGYSWKYGGGTLLVKEGVNLVKDEKAARAMFEEEGWYNSLSMETQETQVQDWVRGPRSVIGEDLEGNIFLGVFSGRTKESTGARFDEMVTIIEREVNPVKNLLNLDGGASSCLGFIYKNEFFELSLPCATNYTCTGMVRPVNSFLIADI